MDYSNIFSYMQAEVTLIAVIVLLFLYDLIAGERGKALVFGGGLRAARGAGAGQCRSGDGGRGIRRHVLLCADAHRRQERAGHRGAHRLPAGRYVAAARRHGPQTGRILHPAAFDAAGHVFHGRGGQFPALLPGHGTGFGADGLPGGVRQVQAPFGRSGCEIHPLRLVRERSDALRHLVLLRDYGDALLRRYGGAHYRVAVAGHGDGLLLRRAGVQDFARAVPSLDGRYLPGGADGRDFLPLGRVRRPRRRSC